MFSSISDKDFQSDNKIKERSSFHSVNKTIIDRLYTEQSPLK